MLLVATWVYVPIIGRTVEIGAALATHAILDGPHLGQRNTLKCSPDSDPRCWGIFTVALNRSVTALRSIGRSRFLLSTEWFQVESPMDRPTGQRNSKL